MLNCSKYFTTLSSNTIYCGVSLPHSTKDVSKLVAVLGSPANPTKTLEQVIDLLTTAYADISDVEIALASGTYGQHDKVYTWPSNASVIRGGGSSTTFVKGNHQFHSSKNLQLLGITFSGGLTTLPVLSFTQDGSVSPWNVWQQDVFVQGTTNSNVPLVLRTILHGVTLIQWSGGGWTQFGRGDGIKWSLKDSTCIGQISVENLEGNVGSGGGMACSFDNPQGGKIDIRLTNHAVIGASSANQGDGQFSLSASQASWSTAPNAPHDYLWTLNSTGAGKALFHGMGCSLKSVGAMGGLQANTENEGTLSVTLSNSSSVQTGTGKVFQYLHQSSGEFKSQLSSVSMENKEMASEPVSQIINHGSGNMYYNSENLDLLYRVQPGVFACTTDNMTDGKIIGSTANNQMAVLGGGNGVRTDNWGSGEIMVQHANRIGNTQGQGTFYRSTNRGEGSVMISQTGAMIKTEKGPIWDHSNQGPGFMKTSLKDAVCENTILTDKPVISLVQKGPGNMQVVGSNNQWRFHTVENVYAAEHKSCEGGNLNATSSGSTCIQNGKGNIDLYHTMDEYSTLTTGTTGYQATTQSGSIIDRLNYGNFSGTLNQGRFVNQEMASKPLFTNFNQCGNDQQMILTENDSASQYKVLPGVSSWLYNSVKGTMAENCTNCKASLEGGGNLISHLVSEDGRVERTVQGTNGNVVGGGSFYDTQLKDFGAVKIRQGNSNVSVDTGNVYSLVADDASSFSVEHNSVSAQTTTGTINYLRARGTSQGSFQTSGITCAQSTTTSQPVFDHMYQDGAQVNVSYQGATVYGKSTTAAIKVRAHDQSSVKGSNTNMTMENVANGASMFDYEVLHHAAIVNQASSNSLSAKMDPNDSTGEPPMVMRLQTSDFSTYKQSTQNIIVYTEGAISTTRASQTATIQKAAVGNSFVNGNLATKPMSTTTATEEAQVNIKSVSSIKNYVISPDLPTVHSSSSYGQSTINMNHANGSTSIAAPLGATEGQLVHSYQVTQNSRCNILHENETLSSPTMGFHVNGSGESQATLGLNGMSTELGQTLVMVESSDSSQLSALANTIIGNCPQVMMVKGESTIPITSAINGSNVFQTPPSIPSMNSPSLVHTEGNHQTQLAGSILTGGAEAVQSVVYTNGGYIDKNNMTLTSYSSSHPLVQIINAVSSTTNSTLTAPNQSVLVASANATVDITTSIKTASPTMPCVCLHSGSSATIANCKVPQCGMFVEGDGMEGTTSASLSNNNTETQVKYMDGVKNAFISASNYVGGAADCQPFTPVSNVPNNG